MNPSPFPFGTPLDRVDGRLKVTGQARYTAEFHPPGMTYGALVQSTIPCGRIIGIDTAAATALPGVLGILTHTNMPRIKPPPRDMIAEGKPGDENAPMQDDCVLWVGQHVAVVIARTLEIARHAASLVRVRYEEAAPKLLAEEEAAHAETPKKWAGREELQVRRGDAAAALAAAGTTTITATYETPVQNHNPIETYCTTAEWPAADQLLVHDTTRWVIGVQQLLANAFSLVEGNVRVLSPFLGGHFGSKGFTWHHIFLAAAAARLVGQPVRLEFTRREMFTTAGRRSRTVQEFALGADDAGHLTVLRHATLTASSPTSEYTEPCGNMSRDLYACPNIEVTHRLARLNLPTPCPMRAPGEMPGVFALECAVDELAWKLKMDPVEFRVRNHAARDEHQDKDYSSKHLLECYRRGAERFGWSRYPLEPRTRTLPDGRLLGWGMATAIYPAKQNPASAKVLLWADRAVVRSATHDPGTGTYTSMTGLAAHALGLPPERVVFELGDTAFPTAPANGGSWLTSSVGPAVLAACAAVKKRLVALALADQASPLAGLEEDDLTLAGGRLFATIDPTRGTTHADILRRAGLPVLEADGDAKAPADEEKYAHFSFGAHFAEVAVDEILGEIRVRRFVGVYDVGRVLNPKLVRSQFLGGLTFGLSAALLENSVPDPRTGRTVNADLAEYHIPTAADIPADIDVSFIDEPDPHFAGSLGAHGVGELGIVGSSAAVANAVFHATGKRLRSLPLTVDKVIT